MAATTPAERLVEAEAALHAWTIGRSVVDITDQSGERVRYNATDVTALRAYIKDLKAMISGGVSVSGPMRFLF